MNDRAKRLAALDDYVSGHLPDDEAAGFEEALFADAARGDAEEASFFDQLPRWTRFIGRHGLIGVSLTRARVEELSRGVRMHMIELQADVALELEDFPQDAEFVVTHLDVDLRGFDSADVIVERPDGTHIKTFHDIGCDPADGSVFAWCEAPLARLALFSGPTVTRVFGEQGGQRKQVAEYHVTPRV